MIFPEILKQYPAIVNIVTTLLLILPFLFLIFNRRLLYGLYVVSIVANLPLMFLMKYNFSYEILLSLLVLFSIIKEWYFNRKINFKINVSTFLLIISLVVIFLINVITSLFHFNASEVKRITTIFVANIFILLIFIYFIKNSHLRNIIIKSIVLGGVILSISIFLELFYNYYILNINYHRYGGLIIDQNGAALVLNLCFILSFYTDRFYRSFSLVIRLIFRLLLVMALLATASRSGLIAFGVSILMLIAYYVYRQELSYKPIALILVLSFLIFIFRHQVSTFLIEFTKMVDLERLSNIFKLSPSLPPNGVGPPSGNPPPVVMDPATSGRWQLIYNTIYVIKNNWLVGVGVGNLPNLIDPTFHMNSHNLWLQLIGESGILMFFTLLFFVIFLMSYIINKQFKNKIIFIFGLIVIFIDSFFNHNLFNLNLIWLFLSLVMASNILSSSEYFEFSYLRSLKVSRRRLLDYGALYKKKYDYEFTIITPTYNRAHLLTNLYYSLVYQTYKNFQWIIINDGSNDETIDLVNQFKDESLISIELLNQENQGKHVAINNGLAQARGRYCLVVDSDDYLTIEALETLVNWFSAKGSKEHHICGVAGLKGTSRMQAVGSFPRLISSITASNIERDHLDLDGDKAECFYTEILKKYPFIQFDDEKYLSERIVWDKIASDGYNIVWHDEIIYICEYQDDGLTSKGGRLLIENPLGYTEFIRGFLQYDYSIKNRIYHLGSYVHHLKKRYNYDYKTLAQLSGIRVIEIVICFKIHKIFKFMKSRLSWSGD